MKKRFVVISMTICLVLTLVGCGRNTNSISKLIKHNKLKDKIKFNDMEWLIKIEEAYKQLEDILDWSFIREKSENYDIFRKTEEDNLPEGVKLQNRTIYWQGSEYTPIGILAGWDILYFEITTIEIDSIDDNEYVVRYRIMLSDNLTDSDALYSDISEKLHIKYGMPYESEITYEKYSDNNGNTLLLTNRNNHVELEYMCNDVFDYIKSIDSKGL